MNPSILKELQELVAANVISQQTADDIQHYYRARTQPATNRFTLVLSILGALLVGLGIVLVVAHNWDELGRIPKTIFAFLPMVIGQALCLYTLTKQKESVAWREASALILFFGVGSCIALVSQIYHIGGELEDFVLTWILLTIPLLYVMRSYAIGLLHIACVTWYACLLGYFENNIPYLYLPLLLMVAPAYIQLLRKNSESNLFILYNWFIAISFPCVLATFVSNDDDFVRGFLGYLTLFSLYYLIGTSNLFRHRRLFANPYMVTAIPGIASILLFWTYSSNWMPWSDDTVKYSLFFFILIVLMGGLLATMLWRYRLRKWEGISPVEFSPFVLQIALAITARGDFDHYQTFTAMPGVLIINIWVLVLGIYFIRKGSIQQHFGILNLGLLIIASLAILRFFDERIPFVWRGIFFLAAGIGFFVANYLLIKKKRALAINQSA